MSEARYIIQHFVVKTMVKILFLKIHRSHMKRVKRVIQAYTKSGIKQCTPGSQASLLRRTAHLDSRGLWVGGWCSRWYFICIITWLATACLATECHICDRKFFKADWISMYRTILCELPPAYRHSFCHTCAEVDSNFLECILGTTSVHYKPFDER